jgi:hypothetical protein
MPLESCLYAGGRGEGRHARRLPTRASHSLLTSERFGNKDKGFTGQVYPERRRMGSKHKQTKESQKSRFMKQAEERKSLLKEKGVAEEAIAKDGKLRQLDAKIRQIHAAVARIDFLDNQTKQLQEKKEKVKAEAEAAKAEVAEPKKKQEGKKKTAAKKSETGKAKETKKTPAKGKQAAKKK